MLGRGCESDFVSAFAGVHRNRRADRDHRRSNFQASHPLCSCVSRLRYILRRALFPWASLAG